MNETPRQPQVLAHLLGIIRRERLAHAYIFMGEPGIGKRETALRFAQALLCTAPLEDAPCGTCSACVRTQNGTHPDFHTLAPENRLIKVEMIRGLQESMGLKTYEGGRRVVLIEDAETMNESAANAFLKTLEEPPPGTVVILVSARPELLPATILSRSQPIRFRPLPWSAVLAYAEAQGLPEADRRVRLAEGRLDVAVREDLVDFQRKVERDLDALLKGDIDAKEVWSGRDEAISWMEALSCVVRDEIVIEVTGSGSLAANPERQPRIPTASGGEKRVRDLLDLARDLASIRARFRFNLNMAITLQWIGSRLRGEGRAA